MMRQRDSSTHGARRSHAWGIALDVGATRALGSRARPGLFAAGGDVGCIGAWGPGASAL